MNPVNMLRNDLSMSLTGDWEIEDLTVSPNRIVTTALHLASKKKIKATVDVDELEPFVTALRIEDELKYQLKVAKAKDHLSISSKENVILTPKIKYTDLFTIEGANHKYVVCGVRRNKGYNDFGVTIATPDKPEVFLTPSQIQNGEIPIYPMPVVKQILKANRVLGSLQQAGGGLLVTREELVKWFDLPTWETISMRTELTIASIAAEQSGMEYEEFECDCGAESDDDCECEHDHAPDISEEYDNIEGKLTDELHDNYDHAVFLTVENILVGFDMDIKEVTSPNFSTDGLYRLTPRRKSTWRSVAGCMLALVNGYDGAAGTHDVSEWLRINDTLSAKCVVYDHMGYMKLAGAVYGGRRDAANSFENHMNYDVG